MPAGSRVRANNVYGTISDNPLLIGATTYTSLGLSLLPAIASPTQHAVVVFDPKRVFGEPEIVVITLHSALGTTATITRAQYGTTARAHPQGTAWAHVPVGPDDYVAIVTSGTRPSNPYEGQLIFETDTNKLIGYGGVDWAPRDSGGQIGYAQVVVNAVGVTTTGTTIVSVGVTVGTGRRILITGYAGVATVASANLSAQIALNEGATQLARADTYLPTSFTASPPMISYVSSPSAGAHTYSVVAYTSTGTSTFVASATIPAFIIVEDIGAA